MLFIHGIFEKMDRQDSSMTDMHYNECVDWLHLLINLIDFTRNEAVACIEQLIDEKGVFFMKFKDQIVKKVALYNDL